MTDKEHIEAIEAVDKLNEYLSDKLVEKFGCSFTYVTNGWWYGINFMDMCLWNNDNDMRKWDEDSNEYEPIYDYVLGEFQEFATMVGNLERLNKVKQLMK